MNRLQNLRSTYLSCVLRHSKTGKIDTFGTTFRSSCGDNDETKIFNCSRLSNLLLEVAKLLTSEATVLAAILGSYLARWHEKIQVSKEHDGGVQNGALYQMDGFWTFELKPTISFTKELLQESNLFVLATDKPKCLRHRQCEWSQAGRCIVRCLMLRYYSMSVYKLHEVKIDGKNHMKTKVGMAAVLHSHFLKFLY